MREKERMRGIIENIKRIEDILLLKQIKKSCFWKFEETYKKTILKHLICV